MTGAFKYTPYAYLRVENFTRERVIQMQQKGLEEMADRMGRDILASGARQVSSVLSDE